MIIREWFRAGLQCHVCGRTKFRCECGWIIAGIIATVAAAAVSAYGMYAQAQQQAAAGKYNAKIAENQAVAAKQAAGMRADTVRERARRIEATNVARAASGGIVPTSGSPLYVMADNAMQAELDAQRVEYGGDVEAAGYNAQARLARYGAGQASEAGMFRAGSTLLSGAVTSAGMWGGRSSPRVRGYNPIDNPYEGPIS
jgi:hypothetical protein